MTEAFNFFLLCLCCAHATRQQHINTTKKIELFLISSSFRMRNAIYINYLFIFDSFLSPIVVIDVVCVDKESYDIRCGILVWNAKNRNVVEIWSVMMRTRVGECNHQSYFNRILASHTHTHAVCAWIASQNLQQPKPNVPSTDLFPFGFALAFHLSGNIIDLMSRLSNQRGGKKREKAKIMENKIKR